MPTRISERPLTGRKVLLILIAFFGVVIGVNVTMMQLAIKTLPGTEVDSAYSASIGYGKEILAARDQSMRNWRVDAHLARDTDGAAELEVEWWRVHREHQREDTEEDESTLIKALTDLYSYVYGVDKNDVTVAAEQRTLAMRYSDQWVEEGCNLASRS